MTTHQNILRMLNNWRGGEFVPKDGAESLAYAPNSLTNFVWLDPNAETSRHCFANDAHAHIERAGLKAVRVYCRENGGSLLVGDHAGMSLTFTFPGRAEWLGVGPDDAAAIEAALVKITGDGT